MIEEGTSFISEPDNGIEWDDLIRKTSIGCSYHYWKLKYDHYSIDNLNQNNFFNYANGLFNIDYKYLERRHIEVLIFIIKKTNYSWRMCAFFFEVFFMISTPSLIISTQISNERCAEDVINLLADQNVDDYIKYRILRNLFLNNRKYYIKIKSANFDKLISEQLVLLRDSQHYILNSSAEFILRKYFPITTY